MTNPMTMGLEQAFPYTTLNWSKQRFLTCKTSKLCEAYRLSFSNFWMQNCMFDHCSALSTPPKGVTKSKAQSFLQSQFKSKDFSSCHKLSIIPFLQHVVEARLLTISDVSALAVLARNVADNGTMICMRYTLT